jgi:hypothetical protein
MLQLVGWRSGWFTRPNRHCVSGKRPQGPKRQPPPNTTTLVAQIHSNVPIKELYFPIKISSPTNSSTNTIICECVIYTFDGCHEAAVDSTVSNIAIRGPGCAAFISSSLNKLGLKRPSTNSLNLYGARGTVPAPTLGWVGGACVRACVRQADRQTGRQADRQTNRQTDRQTDRQAGRQAGRQTGHWNIGSCANAPWG